MTRISKISAYAPESGSGRVGPKDGFVFSDNIEDWYRGPKIKHAARQKDYDRKKYGKRL